jgi:fucose permease
MHVLIALAMTMPASFIIGRLGRKRGFLIAFVVELLGVLMTARGVQSGNFFLFAAGAATMGI